RYFVVWGALGDDHDPAAQLGTRRTAELAQQPRLGTARIRPVAAKPLIMIARDQQPLFRRRPGNHAGDEFETVAQPRVGIGRAGIAKDAGARPVAVRYVLNEL